MIKIVIDEKPFEVEGETTILKAAEQAGIPIPHLCYHPAFLPEGSCRMCLVEIEGLPKLELACSTVIRDGMKVYTKSERVVEARRAVLEFLLAEHPIDCPICDKAGGCKLQDYYQEHGLFESQFREKKEKREKKVRIGKTLLLDQERCILCTRCVRFLKEVTKTQELGVFNRGLHTEINIYNGTPVNNNYSGNLAEICPVGAITDEDFRFKTRSWFLEEGPSVCPLCSRGCNILIEYHKGFPQFPLPKRVYRIKALENQEVNGHWICDLGRYGYSYLDRDRLEHIIGPGKVLARENVTQLLAEKIRRLNFMKKTKRITLILNSWLSNEEIFLIRKIFCQDLGVEKIFFVDPHQGEADDFLLTAERSPNQKGAQELDIEFKPLDLEALVDSTDFLIVFGPFLQEHFSMAEIKEVLDQIETKLLFTPHASELNSLFDIVLPTAYIAEKQGSLTNLEGKIQHFRAVLDPIGDTQPEWKMLVNLGKELRINFTYYRQFNSVEAVFQEMANEFRFFRGEK